MKRVISSLPQTYNPSGVNLADQLQAVFTKVGQQNIPPTNTKSLVVQVDHFLVVR